MRTSCYLKCSKVLDITVMRTWHAFTEPHNQIKQGCETLLKIFSVPEQNQCSYLKMLLEQVQQSWFCSIYTIYCSPPLPLESFFLNLIKSPWIQLKAVFAWPSHGMQLICSVQKLADYCYCFRVGVYSCFCGLTSCIPYAGFSH